MTSLPQHSQRETGTDARSRHAFPWGRRRNTAGNQDHVRTGDWETGTNLSSGEETNHKANSEAGCTNKGVELKAEEAIPAHRLGNCEARTGHRQHWVTVALARYTQLGSKSNQLVLLVRGFMWTALKERNCSVESFLPERGMREQRAGEPWSVGQAGCGGR